MSNLAVIPARGGSKRLPRKNIKKLAGKPLIHYTLEAVVHSGVFDDVLLSSDDEEILEVGSKVHGVTAEYRDPSLAEDEVKVIDLIRSISKRDGYVDKYEKIGLFLPTCPFRTSQHIAEGYKLLDESSYSVVSVTEMDEPVQLSLTIDENGRADLNALLNPSPLVTGETRSQDFSKYFIVNGGFYIAWMNQFVGRENFFQGDVKAYVVDKLHSVDIDYELDFEWAEYLIKNNHVKL